MIIDKVFEFSNAQATGAISDESYVASDFNIDLTGGNAGSDGFTKITGTNIAETLGVGGNLYFCVDIQVVGVFGASVTMQAILVAHSAATSTESGKQIAALLIPNDPAAGERFAMGVPAWKIGATDRYLGVVYKSMDGSITSVTVNAYLTFGYDTQIVA